MRQRTRLPRRDREDDRLPRLDRGSSCTGSMNPAAAPWPDDATTCPVISFSRRRVARHSSSFSFSCPSTSCNPDLVCTSWAADDAACRQTGCSSQRVLSGRLAKQRPTAAG